jgi:transcriptional regulator
MYKLPYFTENNAEEVMKFIRQNPFVTLCGCDESGKPVATQVPVLIKEHDGQLVLRGHVMKNTDHQRAFGVNPEVLALFTGPHTYVSASWYKNPQQGSTWNYLTVHARGKLKFLDEAALIETLRETTAHFENDPTSPASFDQLPAEYINRMTKAIVAFEITVYHMDNVFKLSQNRDQDSYRTITRKLSEQGSDAREIAEEMQRREKKLFDQAG